MGLKRSLAQSDWGKRNLSTCESVCVQACGGREDNPRFLEQVEAGTTTRGRFERVLSSLL